MTPFLTVPLFVASLAVTLGAAGFFARRLDRVGSRLGLPEAVLGLLTALAADGPEITSALVALAKGAGAVSLGVLIGSNIFNLAAMVGLSALLAGRVRLRREALVLEGGVGLLVTLVASALVIGFLSPAVAAVALTCVLGPYVALLLRGSPLARRLGVGGRLAAALDRALPGARPADRDVHAGPVLAARGSDPRRSRPDHPRQHGDGRVRAVAVGPLARLAGPRRGSSSSARSQACRTPSRPCGSVSRAAERPWSARRRTATRSTCSPGSCCRRSLSVSPAPRPV